MFNNGSSSGSSGSNGSGSSGNGSGSGGVGSMIPDSFRNALSPSSSPSSSSSSSSIPATTDAPDSGGLLPSLSSFNSGSVDSLLSGSNEFLNSNSMVAKFSFLLIVLLGFIVLLRIFISVAAVFLSPDTKPMLVNGLIDATESRIITQDPGIKGSIPITRSVNQDGGIEYTWSVWFFIRDPGTDEDIGQLKHIFHKGDNVARAPSSSNDPIFKKVGSNVSPGVFFEITNVPATGNPNINTQTVTLKIAMNKYDKTGGTMDVINIETIPVRKWISLIIKTRNATVDVYINGQLTKRQTLKGIPHQNYGNVYVAQDGGFSGNISDLQYFNYAIGTSELQEIVNRGPSLKTGDSSLITIPKYLSSKWYFDLNG